MAAINQARAEAGLGPLQLNPLLTQAAQRSCGRHDHQLHLRPLWERRLDGKIRVARTGYAANPWVSENWVSASSPAGAMRWWMNDYIHRVNILTPRWQEVGIGVGSRGSEMIFVTDFSAGTGDGLRSRQRRVPRGDAPSVRIQQESVPPGGLDYTIQAGDTLLAIGLRYGLPWERLADENGLPNGRCCRSVR